MKPIVFGIGCHIITGLEAILNEVENKEETQAALENLANSLDMTISELADNIAIVGGYPESSNEVIEKLSELYNDKTIFMDDIQSLKKKIKCSKNPLKKKMLNKQLSECYEEQKKTNTRGSEKDR